MTKTFSPEIGDRVSFVLPNGRRAQGVFKGTWQDKTGRVVARVWRTARKNADGVSVGSAGYHYADMGTLKKGRKVRPVKMFGKCTGEQYSVSTGMILDGQED